MKSDFSGGVLFVSPTSLLGGAERVMQNLASHLLREGVLVVFYSMSRGKQPGWEHLREYENFIFVESEYPSEKKALLPCIIQIIKLTRRYKICTAFSSHTHTNAVLSFLRKMGLLKVEYLIGRESTFIFDRFHGSKRKLFKFFYTYMYGSHDLLICQTQGMKTSLVENLGFIPARKILTVANPIAPRVEALIEDSWPDEAGENFNICVCGRFVAIKNFQQLLQAYQQVAVVNPKLKLHFVGDGPLLEDTKAMAHQLGILEQVVFHGKVEDPTVIFSRCSMGVISSVREGFPNVLLEMMASGVKRIFSTPCTDAVLNIPSLNISRDASVDAMRDALKMLVDSNDNHREVYKQYLIQNHTSTSFLNRVKRAICENEGLGVEK